MRRELQGTLVRRHSLIVRVTHWINALCLAILLMSGLQIFNAHPALYWGNASDFERPVLAMTSDPDQAGAVRGRTTILGASFDTTGVLGVSRGPDGGWQARGFPAWATLPSYQDLATGRRWHFFFAWALVLNGVVYLASGLANGHVRRDLLPTASQMRHIGRSVWDHLRLRFPRGDEAKHYNVLQKLSYLGIAFVLLPLMVATGLAMSPAIDAVFPALLSAFGGRQSARAVHFVAASGLVLFVVVHVVMVLLSGAWNNMRSMITGRYSIPAPGGSLEHPSA